MHIQTTQYFILNIIDKLLNYSNKQECITAAHYKSNCCKHCSS